VNPSSGPSSGPAASLRQALAGAARGLVEREALVETIALAGVAGEHVLVIGPPGTAKSEAVRRVARASGARYFEYLLGSGMLAHGLVRRNLRL
jgi:MoxR-like ATPase